ncbi:TOPBP1 interacting checkpoint and replication regulator [Phyllostomus discolor]|uniref:TOPBP1 interacting checkpoint and replication regulator n=2 Tax=Phyllostomus discolor TaxID=89673 RepID=A0A833YSA4_9CHIR|nr:TOPBP1 interacting checkpoint and replication regulator [Phyllostomus discolor]
MACRHNVMLLLDTAGGTAGHGLARRAALRLLIYLSCRFGLARVRWAFRFFDSLGARSRPSRVSDFRELGARSWEDFEEELEARLGEGAPGTHLPGPAPRATHTHGALMETLLDYQWDRPEITSPAKPVLRSSGRRLLDVESEAREAEAALGGFGNAVFLLAPCPHSRRELLQFVSGCEARAQGPLPTARQLMEKLLPKRVQEGMLARKITLYWVDTAGRSQLRESPDHLGYWAVCELLQQVGGAILPSETWSQDSSRAGETPLGGDTQLSSEPGLLWTSTLPTDSTLNCSLYNSPEYEASFPRTEGTLFLPVEGKEVPEAWAVVLEPLAMHQRHFQKPVRIFLKGMATRWSPPMSGTMGSDSWMLRSPGECPSTQRALFQQLVDRLTAEELHLVASVDPGDGWPPITGVMSPLSARATVLTVFRVQEAALHRHVLQAVAAESPQDAVPLFPDVVDVVLSQTHTLLEGLAAPASPGPEWVQQELGCTAPWTPAVTESWFPCSNLSGTSSSLMESFCLLQAAPSSTEEPSQTESELTRRLSELYLRKAREESAAPGPEDRRRTRGVPCTPVRQKMNAMCRSLKMLNVARLNVKAQKLHPDASPEAAGERGVQKTAGGRAAAKLESRGRTRSSRPRDFKTEEELQSYLHENYQKTVAAGGAELHSCAQNMISTVKAFLKSRGSQDAEADCLDQVERTLLKTSRSLRQNIGKNLGKEDRVRECQLQVFLRLELCRQCPLVPDGVGAVEQAVDEVTDLLRTVCLTEDSAYLAKFLEEILSLYTDSIPETLGKLYDSLGFVIPQKLADVLPTDFFSDDSVTQDTQSPRLSVPLPSSAPRSASGGTESHQLEELRTRSAKKRRKNAWRRHKSVAEVSQSRRQIEIPRVSKRAAKNETSRPGLRQPPLLPKDTVQEVTKVRRNLFNQEFSPSKRPAKRGLPRSYSVSAAEGLARELDSAGRTTGHRRLLTRTVAETPEHKQVSRRLLHRQVKGRSSDPGPDVNVVEESPEREIGLRRSPRIKQLSLGRTSSGPFYPVSPPKARSVQRAPSLQRDKPDQRQHSATPSVQSPKKLLFGAVSQRLSPSEKGTARTQRPPGKKPAAELPADSQTPRKSARKSPRSPAAAAGRLPGTPQTPLRSPERRLKPPVVRTPARQALFRSFQDSPTRGCHLPSPPKLPARKGRPLLERGASPLGKIPRTPGRPHGQPLGFLQDPAWSPAVNSSPGSPSGLAATEVLSTGQCRSRSPTFSRGSVQLPPGEAGTGMRRDTALVGTPPNQNRQHPCILRAAQGEEPAQERKVKAVRTPERPGDTPTTPSPPASPKEPLPSPVCGGARSPLGTPAAESPPPAQPDWGALWDPGSGAPSLSHPTPSAAPRTSQSADPDVTSGQPPAHLRTRDSGPSDPEGGFPEGEPSTSAAFTDTRKHPKDADPASPRPPQRLPDPGPGCSSDWRRSSPSLVAGDTGRLALLEEAECHGARDQSSGASPAGGGAGLRTGVADERPSPSPLGDPPPSPPCSGPSSPLTPSCALRCSDHKGLCPAATPTWRSGVPAKVQTYEVELEMQASGVPKVRIKKTDTSPRSESEPPRRAQSVPPGLGVPRGSKPPCKPETTYMSPPCLRLSHSSPGRSGGQTYICQSCAPSTPSPFQTDVGVPWTPSPKHSGKTTPDGIKDWPRRKRAALCSLGTAAGRGDAGTDLPAGGPLLPPEDKEPGLRLGTGRSPLLGDFELEGVCQLPDRSPPGDSESKAEEAFSWGQFGLGPRKRLLSAEEEAEWEARRVRDRLRGDSEVGQSEERSLGMGVQQLPTEGVDEAPVSRSPPPPGCAPRSCLSAGGLQALTQSPLLFPGKTGPAQRRDAADEDTDVFPPTTEDSPFSQAFSRRRPISRTYSRRKLIS